MKKMILLLSAVVLLAACHSRQNEAIMQKSSSGKTLEVLVAADKGSEIPTDNRTNTNDRTRRMMIRDRVGL